jgi:hypothetical protein
LGEVDEMRRRCNDALYFTDELVQKIVERRPVRVCDCVEMLFPQDTNRKQFECALQFLQELEKRGNILNTEALGLFQTANERYLLAGKVLPKLKKFRVVEWNGNNGSKKYSMKLGEGFSGLLRDLGVELLRSNM